MCDVSIKQKWNSARSVQSVLAVQITYSPNRSPTRSSWLGNKTLSTVLVPLRREMLQSKESQQGQTLLVLNSPNSTLSECCQHCPWAAPTVGREECDAVETQVQGDDSRGPPCERHITLKASLEVFVEEADDPLPRRCHLRLIVPREALRRFPRGKIGVRFRELVHEGVAHPGIREHL